MQRLGDGGVCHHIDAVEIRNRTRHAKHAVISTRAQTEPIGGTFKTTARFRRDAAVREQPLARDIRVDANAIERRIASVLARTRRFDACADCP